MINKTKWFSGLALVAIVGSAATPIIASAHGSSSDDRSAQDVTAEGKARGRGARATAHGIDQSLRPAGHNGHEKILGRKLADALGVTPEALAEAVRAARASVPRPTGEQKRDPAARQAYAAAIEAAIAQHLGITVEAFNAAQAAVKAEAQEKRDDRRQGAEAKKRAHFLKTLNRLVGAGIITQPQADEILAQFDLRGDARERAIKHLRALLEDRREQKRDDQREEKREQKDQAGKRALERLPKQHRPVN